MESSNSASTEHPSHDLKHLVDHLAHYLPAQGPIGVFIHHNTLHAFQNLPFEQAVLKAARTFDAEPYLKESAYRAAFETGRIRLADLEEVLAREGVDTNLRHVMLVPGIRTFLPHTMEWQIQEDGVTSRFRNDLPIEAMRAIHSDSAEDYFQFWLSRTPTPLTELKTPTRPRDGILHATGIDIDSDVHPLLIKLVAAFLDQGLAYWPMPNKQDGFWAAALRVLGQSGAVESTNLRQLRDWTHQWSSLDSSSAILAAFDTLGLAHDEWAPFLEAELLALPGWAGMIRQLEQDPTLAPHERLSATLLDYIAVRLLITVSAVHSVLPQPSQWRRPFRSPSGDLEAIRLAQAATYFDASQLAGLSLKSLKRMNASQLEEFQASVNRFDDWERRRIWHLAYERRHERQILLPLRKHASTPPAQSSARLAAQVFFCIDEREESIRRHLEEVDPTVETIGAAGFFGVAMNYAGIDDAAGVSLCPVVVKPGHAVSERPVAGHEHSHSRRLAIRRFFGKLAHISFISSRTLVRGWLGTSILGIFSLFPLAARVLSPRHYGRLVTWLNESILPEPRTELAFMRSDESGHQALAGLLPGYSIAEKIDIVARVLGPAGLHKTMARLVVILGHGSTSLNNPHESAYDCGACGGHRGGPNARIFSAMANRPEVRTGLRDRGIFIPEDTWFVGGYHDTCNDSIDLYDLEDLPSTHQRDLDRLRVSLDAARARSAHERSRRFDWAVGVDTPQDGLRHVQERAEHIAEPRPEYGHGTNAVCIVGRRSTTRGLFLDRRAFLVSYDATLDPTNASLAQVLNAVIPVCAGINLEYYFSTVDNERYGCGTKLPHNVTGLLGVMNGYESDLRTGLALQTVEIHEPVRILFIVETTPDRLIETVRANPLLWEFLSNRWIRLAVMDPVDGSRLLVYRGEDHWEPAVGNEEKLHYAASSMDWYRGHQEHLPMARIKEPELAVR